MVRDLVIHSDSKGVEIALLEDKKLVEYYLDQNGQQGFTAGDIYLGRVKKLNPGLNAAFVDIGHNKDAFLHYTDLSPSILTLKKFSKEVQKGNTSHLPGVYTLEPEIEKEGSIDKVLSKGDLIIVQILKEAISTKGPRLTCELSIAGRYVVLTPFTNSIGVSKKIDSRDERKRLQHIIDPVRPKNMGFVARTNAQGIGNQEISMDVKGLMEKWKKLTDNIRNKNHPALLLSEIDKSLSILRDIISDSFSKIIADSPLVMDDLKNYLEKSAPQMVSLLHLHRSPTPLFEEYGISKQIKSAFGKTVTMKSGAYLVIEHTEALHVIDVNSGPKINNTADQDLNAFNVNAEAALEIARQMRLRDIGGIIVIDFIDMRSGDFRAKLLDVMHQAMRSDKAKHSILPVSKFGLMEITRQRVKKELIIDTTEPNPEKDDRVETPLLLIDKIQREILSIPKNGNNKYLLYVHPFVDAYLKRGWMPIHWKWWRRSGIWVKIIEDSSLNLLDYIIVDHKERDIAG